MDKERELLKKLREYSSKNDLDDLALDYSRRSSHGKYGCRQINEFEATAMELAGIGTDKAIKGLIEIVNGGPWWTFGFRYSYQSQLMAIKALGETGKQESLDFLKKLYTICVREKTEILTASQYRRQRMEYVTYPYSRGRLRNHLKTRSPCNGNTESFSINVTEERGPTLNVFYGTLGHDTYDEYPHRIIYQAIKKLEVATKKAKDIS